MAPYKITLDGMCVIETKVLNIFTFLCISKNWLWLFGAIFTDCDYLEQFKEKKELI